MGTHLARLLSQEDQDIILMDENEENLVFPSSFEIMTAVGNPTSIKDLKSIRVKEADIFIAVTPEEAVNMTACMLARTLGAQKTIARISNTEYLLPINIEFFSRLGVDSLICPELLAANEIVSTLKTPWTRQWWEIAGGKLVLLGTKVRENAPLVNKYLYELSSEKKIFHIVAIQRGTNTIIPCGDDRILPEDLVYFISTREHIEDVRKSAGKEEFQVSKIMLMGASRIALKVCELLPSNLKVKLVEENKEKSYRIAESLPENVMVINGDGRNTDLLVQENIKTCDAFIALTGNSETNILSCVSAKGFGVRKTIAEVENLDYISMADRLNIGNVINKKLIASSHIYQFLLNADVSTVKCLTFADADVAELVAREGSKITRKQVKDLHLPNTITLGGLVRNGEVELIEGNTQIVPGDHVVVFCLNTAMRKIEELFN